MKQDPCLTMREARIGEYACAIDTRWLMGVTDGSRGY
jgi:hypothetical protein